MFLCLRVPDPSRQSLDFTAQITVQCILLGHRLTQLSVNTCANRCHFCLELLIPLLCHLLITRDFLDLVLMLLLNR